MDDISRCLMFAAGSAGSFTRPPSFSASFSENSIEYVTATPATALNLTSNFTMEMWFKPKIYFVTTSGSKFGSKLLLSANGSGDEDIFSFYCGFYDYDRYVRIVSIFPFVETENNTATIYIPLDQPNIEYDKWKHIAITKNQNTFSFYLDGSFIGSATSSTISSTPMTKFVIGGRPFSFPAGNRVRYNGNISNVRIDSSVLYTSNFTPTGPLASTSTTKVLTLQNATFIDNSPTPATITKVGNVFITNTDHPFL